MLNQGKFGKIQNCRVELNKKKKVIIEYAFKP